MKEIDNKVGGNYDEFISELQEIRQTLNNKYDECTTHLAQQIIEETIMSFDNLIKEYEIKKDIEITSAMDI